MKKHVILGAALAAMLVAGCGGAKFAEEKTLLAGVTKAMETFTAAVEKADAPPAIASAVNAFSGQVEKLIPAMKKMNDEHPDWVDNPPSELKGAMDKFKSASAGFQGVMPKVMQMAGQHADDANLQDALKKFQSVVSGL